MSIERAGLIICGLFLVIAIVGCIVDHEARRPKKRKPNIRVPRQTLWGRTNRYHNTDTH